MKKEIKIALVAIAAIVILFFGMNFLKGISLFSEKNVYYARFSNINGLTANNPIFANGYQVGLVKDIQFDYSGQGDIIVAFSLNDKMHLPVGTAAAIESDFMGNVRMNLVLPTTNTPLPTGRGRGWGSFIKATPSLARRLRGSWLAPQPFCRLSSRCCRSSTPSL